DHAQLRKTVSREPAPAASHHGLGRRAAVLWLTACLRLEAELRLACTLPIRRRMRCRGFPLLCHGAISRGAGRTGTPVFLRLPVFPVAAPAAASVLRTR